MAYQIIFLFLDNKYTTWHAPADVEMVIMCPYLFPFSFETSGLVTYIHRCRRVNQFQIMNNQCEIDTHTSGAHNYVKLRLMESLCGKKRWTQHISPVIISHMLTWSKKEFLANLSTSLFFSKKKFIFINFLWLSKQIILHSFFKTSDSKTGGFIWLSPLSITFSSLVSLGRILLKGILKKYYLEKV